MNEAYHAKKLREMAESNIEQLISENEQLKADNEFFKILLDIPVDEEVEEYD